MTVAASIRVAIVGIVRLYREGLTVALRRESDLDVVAVSRRDSAACAAVAETRPDIVVVDVSETEGVLSLPDVGNAFPSARIVALAVDYPGSSLLQLLQAEVRGYVTSDMTIDDLTSTIRRVVAGETVYSRGFERILIRHLASWRTTESHIDDPRLTQRERQVLDLLRQHLSNKEIADVLGISEATVKNHVHHVLEKLNLTRRSQAAALALPLSRHGNA